MEKQLKAVEELKNYCINELTNEVYNSVSECIQKLNISTKAFYRNINGKGRFKNKYKLSYVRTIKKS